MTTPQEFMAQIAGELMKLGYTLYEHHKGDVKAALYDIADERARIASRTAARGTDESEAEE